MEQSPSPPNPVERYSPEQKQYLLAEFKESGLSVRDFCQLHNIADGTFRKWQMRQRRKQLKLQEQQLEKSRDANGRAAGQAGFAEVQIMEPSSPMPESLVLFAEVSIIKIYQPVSASYLKDLQ